VGIAPPPYRIETDRLVIRCWEPRDAPLAAEAVTASLDHLRPWMPWAAREPTPLDERIELFRSFRGRFDLDQDYTYGVFSRDESEVVGGSGLHTRVGEGAFEIGYWIRSSAIRRGLATEVTATLTRIAFEVCGVDRVEIRVEPSNTRSTGIARKLGFSEEATLGRRLPPQEEGGPLRDVIVFTMFAADFPRSPCARAPFDAYDAAGRALTR
jgi:RimJ/RimL family protein N-acetyltransferase